MLDYSPILTMNPVIDFVQTSWYVVTGPATPGTMHAGIAFGCVAMWNVAAPFCMFMYSATLVSFFF
mgnify:CR=1 FL=1